jgi:hypothetical protein
LSGRRRRDIEERSFVAALLWMTAKCGGCMGRIVAKPDGNWAGLVDYLKKE